MAVVILGIFRILAFYPRASHRRGKSKTLDTEIDRITVMHVMSKFEIMQHGKLQEETNRVKDKNIERYIYKIREKIWQGVSYE